MKFKTWVGLAVLVVCIEGIAPAFYGLLYALGVDRPQLFDMTDCFVSCFFCSPINFDFYNMSLVLTSMATLLLGACALILVVTGRALKVLAFLCSLMLAHQGTILLVGGFDFILSSEKSTTDLWVLVPSLVMTTIAYGVLRVFQRAWNERSVTGGPFVATPIVRFYGCMVDLTVIQTLVQNRIYSLDMSSYQWLVALVSYVLYYVIFERMFLFTPGKLLVNTRVSMLNGSEPGVATIVLRTLVRLIPFEPLSCLYNEGWHDELSKTKVVRHPWAGGLVTTG
jgi:uncharacterized RDD family membrane protein YckC